MIRKKISISAISIISLLVFSVILFTGTIAWTTCNFWWGKWCGSSAGIDYDHLAWWVEDDVEEAYEIWNDESDMDFDIVDNDSSYSDVWVGYYGESWYGLTDPRSWYGNSPACWIEVDIYLNAYYVDYPPYVDPVTVFAHEFGHFLGLYHSDEDDALMHWEYDGVQRELDGDDVECIEDLYP